MRGKKQKDWRSFEEARIYARSLGLQTRCEWMNSIDGRHSWLGRKPSDIPNNPAEVYKFDWRGWNDWLGVGNIPVKKNNAPVKTVRRENLRLKKARSLERIRKIADPENSLSKPIAPNSFCSFEEARKYARKLGLESHYEWNRFVCKHLKTIPANIPRNPAAIYRFEWRGWQDWLGISDRRVNGNE